MNTPHILIIIDMQGVSMLKKRGYIVISIFSFALIICGILKVTPNMVSVSNSVGGRELPIYCVATDKKQVALTFDAAWGNG